MKTIASLAALALLAVTFAPQPVQAGEKERAILGGLIGGIIIGAAIADDDVRTQVNVSYHQNSYRSPGYWSWVSVKTWVPGYYERSCDRFGHPRRVWVSGRYTLTKQKVWVDAQRRNEYRHGHDYRDRGHRDYRDRHGERRQQSIRHY